MMQNFHKWFLEKGVTTNWNFNYPTIVNSSLEAKLFLEIISRAPTDSKFLKPEEQKICGEEREEEKVEKYSSITKRIKSLAKGE